MRTSPHGALPALNQLCTPLFRLILPALIATTLIASSAYATLPGEWEGFGGPAGWEAPVAAIIRDGDNLIIGGEFTRINSTDNGYIAMWDSTRYLLLGPGVPGPVYALLSTDSGLVAGGWWLGDLPKAYSSFVSIWDGAEWQRMSDGFNNRVSALAEFGGEVIAGGRFTWAGVTSLGRIARWDGSEWYPVGGAGFDGDVNALLVYGGDLVAAGEFTAVDGIPANGLAVWNGTSWSGFPGGGVETGAWVQTLTVYGGDLIAGGSFQTIGGSSIPHLAKWNGASWQSIGTGVNGQVRTVTVHGTDLAVGGIFDQAGGSPAGNVAIWDGASWLNLAGGADAEVSALASYGGKLVAGGWFQSVGGDSLPYFAHWDGVSWGNFSTQTTPGGTDGTVRSVLETPDGIIVAGNITLAGSTAVQDVARLVNGEWEAMGSALTGKVWDLYSFHDSIFAGGVGFQGVRRWDPGVGDWVTVANNLNQTVACLGEHDGFLIAGGNFQRTGDGDTVCFAAQRVNDKWIPMGRLTGGTVRAFDYWQGNLIAAGDILEDTSSGEQFDRVAQWNGTNWQSMGSGMNKQVHSLTNFEGELIAGGYFDTAGGEPASSVARWNGSTWGPMTDPTPSLGGILSVNVYNGELYAGGTPFVRWTGSDWESPFGGVQGVVYDMQIMTSLGGPALMVGGTFDQVGPIWSDRIGLWRTTGIPTSVATGDPPLSIHRLLLGPNRPNPFNPSTAIDFLVPEAGIVTLTIHDIGGRIVARLISGHQLPGSRTVYWDGRSDNGRQAASGVYFTKLQVGDRTEFRKITLVR